VGSKYQSVSESDRLGIVELLSREA